MHPETQGHTRRHTHTSHPVTQTCSPAHIVSDTHTHLQSSQVHTHIYENARHRHTHSSATESYWLQLRPLNFLEDCTQGSVRKSLVSDAPPSPQDLPSPSGPGNLKVYPTLAIPTGSQPQAQPGFTAKFPSTPSPALPSVTHHPKPPKETLRFLPNMVVAEGRLVQRRPRSCWQDCSSLGAAGSTASHEGRGTHCGTSPIACPPTQLPVGEAVGWEVCPGPQDAPRQAGEVEEGSFPSPGGTRSSGRARLADCTTAQVGSSAPHRPGFLEPTEAEDSHDCAWVGGGRRRETQLGALQTGPHTNFLGLPEVGPWPFHFTLPDKPAHNL